MSGNPTNRELTTWQSASMRVLDELRALICGSQQSRSLALGIIDPVLPSGFHYKLRPLLDGYMERMQARGGLGWAKTEYVVIRNIVRDSKQTRFQILRIVKATELASREFCDRFGRVRAQRIACSQKSHGDQPKGRSKLADAVENLLAVVSLVF